jgi:hypothetical protein
MGRKPVWTAFVTHQISSKRWMRRETSKTIQLTDLQPFIFGSDYVPQLGPVGEHVLRFANSEGTSVLGSSLDGSWWPSDLGRGWRSHSTGQG